MLPQWAGLAAGEEVDARGHWSEPSTAPETVLVRHRSIHTLTPKRGSFEKRGATLRQHVSMSARPLITLPVFGVGGAQGAVILRWFPVLRIWKVRLAESVAPLRCSSQCPAVAFLKPLPLEGSFHRRGGCWAEQRLNTMKA